MIEPSIAGKGLFLLENSPFKLSLPRELDYHKQQLNVDEAINAAQNEDLIFSDVGKFLKNRNHLCYEYYNKLTERLLKHKANFISGSLHNELVKDPGSAHLKIKLLSEYALTRVPKDERLMDLEGIKSLGSHIEELNTMKSEIEHQLEQNNKIIDDTFISALKNDFSMEDLEILRTLVSSNQALMKRLSEVHETSEAKQKLLSSQYLLVLSLCYFEDLRLSLPEENFRSETLDRETEELMSYVVSLAVQRNIVLPAPNPDATKSQWAKDCLDSLLLNTADSPAELKRAATLRDTDINRKEKEISRLNTALTDLQFAHQYLTRRFEEERNLNSTTIESLQKTTSSTEKRLSETLALLEKSNQRSILVEHEKNVLETKLDDTIKELNDVKRQLTNMKIDSLGHVSNANTSSEKENSFLTPEIGNRLSPTSPITGLELQLDRSTDLHPKTPLLQKDMNNYRSQSPSSSKYNSSISVLRGEFKKLVNDIHNNFESELTKERNERKRLENLVKLYEVRSNEIDI